MTSDPDAASPSQDDPEPAGTDTSAADGAGPAAGPGPSILFVALLVALGGVLLLGAAAYAITQDDDDPEGRAESGDGWNGIALAEPQPRPDFSLTDVDTGEGFDFQAETEGELTLLFFGYTTCPDICPVQMHILAQALTHSGMPQPNVVFVTTDPDQDTPERVRAFLDEHDSSFIGLTGTREEIAAAEEESDLAPSMLVSDDPGEEPDLESGDYEVAHASQVIAITPDDQAHVVYPSGTREQDWVHDLPLLLEEYG